MISSQHLAARKPELDNGVFDGKEVADGQGSLIITKNQSQVIAADPKPAAYLWVGDSLLKLNNVMAVNFNKRNVTRTRLNLIRIIACTTNQEVIAGDYLHRM
ncbi:hypothetical protein Y5W_02895 [Alcanivorax sp. 521-1]|uniref:PDZ domain-containing protein n=1 Tax=Alloalcanivorax profundimaris TaxID=2735259 RepID=A0ABS0ATY5_9GAMM|nr:hypothetical protein [Alloalcanivorax profundimaris]